MNNARNISFNEFLEKAGELLKETYFYNQIIFYEEEKIPEHEHCLSVFLFYFLTALILLGFFKALVLIVISIIKFIMHLIRMFYVMIASKCSVNIFLMIKKICRESFLDIQKLYTFNFYCYTNALRGIILVITYLFFLLNNYTFALIAKIKERKIVHEWTRIALIFSFFITIFFEIYISTFYFSRQRKKCFFINLGFFLTLLFLFPTMTVIELASNTKDKKENLSPLGNFYSFIVFSALAFLNFLSLKKIRKYNLNEKAILRYIMNRGYNQISVNTNSNSRSEEVKYLTKQFLLKNSYITKGDKIFYKFRDRYRLKKILNVLFLLGVSSKLFLCLFVAIQILFNFQMKEFKEFFSFLNITILNILCWFTFMKVEIKTYFLY